MNTEVQEMFLSPRKTREYQLQHAIPEVNSDLARYVLSIVDEGLGSGLGGRRPGQLCVEGAVAFAMGKPIGSYKPDCVANDARWFMVALNDFGVWNSNKERAKGLRRLSIAQLGSRQLPRKAFTMTMVHLFFRDLMIPSFLKKADKETAKKLRTLQRCKDIPQMRKTLNKIDYLPGPYSIILENSLSHDNTWYSHGDCMAEDMIRLCMNRVSNPTLAVVALMEKALKKCKSPGVRFLPLARHQYTLPQ